MKIIIKNLMKASLKTLKDSVRKLGNKIQLFKKQ